METPATASPQESLFMDLGEAKTGWDDLPEAERHQWRQRSESEQRAVMGSSLRPDGKISDRLIEARAKTLFMQSKGGRQIRR